MRWLFLLLLAANLLFFSWNWFRDDDHPTRHHPTADTAQGEKGLILLSELKSAEKNPPGETDRSASQPERASPEPATGEPAAPSAVKPSTHQPATGTAPARAKTATRDEPICYVLGPFGSSNVVQEVLKRTINSPAIVERRWSSPQQRPGYWVHIPPAGSSNEARSIVRILNQAGISDVQLITSGEMRNAISLGIFSTMQNARKRQQEVTQQGFEVVIDEVKIRKRLYWLALRGSGGRALSRELLDRVTADADEAEIEQRPCSELPRRSP